MSEEKNVIKLTDEQLEQIAGGMNPEDLLRRIDPGRLVQALQDPSGPQCAFICGSCGQPVIVPAESLNLSARCPKCGGKLLKF